MGIPFMSPSPGINYNFVVGAYFVCTLILGVLFTLDKLFGVEAVEGAWIVFAPFVPCLVWAVAVRAIWIAQRKSGVDKTKEE